jgi:hypothetical protein
LGKKKEEEEEEERRQRWAANDVFIWSFGAYSFLGGENCEGGRFLLLIIDEDVKLDFDAMATEMTTQHNTTRTHDLLATLMFRLSRKSRQTSNKHPII